MNGKRLLGLAALALALGLLGRTGAARAAGSLDEVLGGLGEDQVKPKEASPKPVPTTPPTRQPTTKAAPVSKTSPTPAPAEAPSTRILSSFESKTELRRWQVSPASHAKLSPAHATHGDSTLRLLAPVRLTFDLKAAGRPTDWSVYDTFTLDLHNPQPYALAVKLTLRGAGGYGAGSAHDATLTVPARATLNYALALDQVPAKIRADVRNLSLELSQHTPPRPDTLYLDTLKLVKTGTPEQTFVVEPDDPKSRGGDFGSGGSALIDSILKPGGGSGGAKPPATPTRKPAATPRSEPPTGGDEPSPVPPGSGDEPPFTGI